MKSLKLTFFAAAASLTFAGAALAQTALTPGQQTPLTASPMATPSLPTTTPVPPMDRAATTSTATPSASMSAEANASPISAIVASDYTIGTQVRDPSGVVVGAISGSGAAADGSINVTVTSGATKFALPSASLYSNAGALTTTATKAQIDATVASAKAQ
ncbi:MAG: hypothetical protein PSX79_16445 [bacterium]|nr:hypothetical protein [bacterium]